jgi:hypothetical protein
LAGVVVPPLGSFLDFAVVGSVLAVLDFLLVTGTPLLSVFELAAAPLPVLSELPP